MKLLLIMDERSYDLFNSERNLNEHLKNISNSKFKDIDDFLSKYFINTQYFFKLSDEEITTKEMLNLLKTPVTNYLTNSANANILEITKNNKNTKRYTPANINLYGDKITIIGYGFHNKKITHRNKNRFKTYLEKFDIEGNKINNETKKTMNFNLFMHKYFYNNDENAQLETLIINELLTMKERI